MDPVCPHCNTLLNANYSTDHCDVTLKLGVIQNSASPQRFSRGSDTKTALSAGDITAISPAVLPFCVHPSPLWLGLCVIPLSEHAARTRRSLHHVLNVPLKCLFPQLTGDKERRRRCERETMVDSNLPFADHAGESTED